MSEVQIVIPTTADLPAEMRPPVRRMRFKPRLPKVAAIDVPEALGWYVVVLPVAISDELEDSKLVLVKDTVRHMHLSRRVGAVLAIGPLSFSERRGYPPNYAPIAVGDWVSFHEDSGVSAVMVGEDEEMVSIKYIEDRHLFGRIKRPESYMVIV